MSQLLRYLKEHQETMLGVLRDVVTLESPSDNRDACNKLVNYFADQLKAAGCGVELLEQGETGNHLKAVWGDKNSEGQILVLSHLDTVWPMGTIKERPFRIEGERAVGPGVHDMKTGAVQTLFAIRALRALGFKPKKQIVLIYNTDEEIGSPTSRPIIEGEAKNSDAVLVLEPSIPPQGAIKTFRKGVGGFQVRITGKAAHAGADPEKGVDAIEELAHQIMHFKSLADKDKGTSVNVGVVKGGTRSNVVPAEATAHIDVRVTSLQEADRIMKEGLHVKHFVAGTKVEVSGGINRPPMIRTEKTVEMFELARNIADELGFKLVEGSTGGASDGNFTAAMGIPTLDGLGAVGDGGHAVHEYVDIPHIVPRTALLARLMEIL